MVKMDYKLVLKPLYQPAAGVVVQVDVPPIQYLMVDGAGDPNHSQTYAQAIEALFGLSYTLKFMVKKGPLAVDYGVMPLEGLWWAEDMSRFSTEDKSNWLWTSMIAQPPLIDAEMVALAAAELKKKKDPAALSLVRFETFNEGKCAQTLHIGPFSAEGPTIEKVHAFIATRGELSGKHHEIYLSDINRTDPARWRTIVRQPMR